MQQVKESISPQEFERRWLPGRQKFVVALSGWGLQKKHIFLRRMLFLAIAACAASAGLAIKVFLSGWLPRWVGWTALAAALTAAISAGMSEAEQKKLRLALFVVFFTLAGAAVNLLAPLAPGAAFWIMAFTPPAGSLVNVLFFRKAVGAEEQFLLLGPWLAAALLAACFISTAAWQIAAGGGAGLMLSYLLIRTEQASLCVRSPEEVFSSAADALAYFVQFLLGPLRGE
jgi:hypothetical protein